VIPNLKLQLGGQEIPVLYVHTVVFSVQGCQDLDSAEFAVTFRQKPKIFGTLPEAPSPLHKNECTELTKGYGERCQLGPLKPGDKFSDFRLMIATDQKAPSEVITATTKLQLISLDEFLRRRTLIFGVISPDSFGIVLSMVMASATVLFSVKMALPTVIAELRKALLPSNRG
jgi:hypothetical protein